MNTFTVDNSRPCTCCGLYANRGLGIDAIIVKDDTILLIKRNGEPFKGMWALPGGYIDWNISAEDTVIKEVKEETNLDVLKMKLFGIYSKPDRHPKQGMALVYVVEVSGVVKPGDDAAEAKYFDFDNLPEQVGFDHIDIIKKYVSTTK